MRPVLALLCVVALAACGADGEPEPPEPKVRTGLTISGTASVGVTF